MKKLLFLSFLLFAIPVSAQTPTNPTGVSFTSVDHAIVTNYEVGIFLLGAVAPTTTVNVGKPTPAADGTISATINTRPVGLGSYELKVRAISGTTVSAWGGGGTAGDQPVPFDRVLSRPANLKAVP